MKLIKHVLTWLYNLLWILVHPTYWIQNESSDKYLDAWYQEGLDQGEVFTIVDDYRAEFRGKEVWIGNDPYASFTRDGYPNAMPNRRLRAKLQAKLAPVYTEYRLNLLRK